MNVSLMDDEGTQLKRTLTQQEFTGNESYQDVIAILRGLFDSEHDVCRQDCIKHQYHTYFYVYFKCLGKL